MKPPTLYDSLASRDSFKELTKLNSPIAAQAAKAAANVDNMVKYELELEQAQQDYNDKLKKAALRSNRSSRYHLDPEVTAASDRVKKAAAAIKSNKNKAVEYQNIFNLAAIKLEEEYRKIKGSISSGGGVSGGVKFPKRIPKPPLGADATANEKYDPNYGKPSNIWFPPKDSTTNNPQVEDTSAREPIVVVQPEDRKPVKFVNRRPTPPKPKPKVRGTPKPLSRPGNSNQNTSIITTNTSLDGNPGRNIKDGLGTGPCPPGSTGRGIDYGCTTPDGATFIA